MLLTLGLPLTYFIMMVGFGCFVGRGMKIPLLNSLQFNTKISKWERGRDTKAGCANELCFSGFVGPGFQDGAGWLLEGSCGCCSTHKNLLDQKIREHRGWQSVLLQKHS